MSQTAGESDVERLSKGASSPVAGGVAHVPAHQFNAQIDPFSTDAKATQKA